MFAVGFTCPCPFTVLASHLSLIVDKSCLSFLSLFIFQCSCPSALVTVILALHFVASVPCVGNANDKICVCLSGLRLCPHAASNVND